MRFLNCLIVGLTLFGVLEVRAQSGLKLGSSPGTLNSSSILDLSGVNNRGLLLPRVALSTSSSAAPLTAHVQGMVVYNTTNGGGLVPGVYFNTGSAWVLSGSDNLGNHTAAQDLNMGRFEVDGFADATPITGNNDTWKIYGSGLANEGTLRIQTGDDGNEPIIFEQSTSGVATERMRIHSNGNVGIGTNNPLDKLHVQGGIRVSDLAGVGFRTVVVNSDGLFGTTSLTSANIYNTDGTLTGSRILTQGANTLTFTGAGNINKFSGSNTDFSRFSIGRTVSEGEWGVVGNSGQGFPLSSAGDVWFRTNLVGSSLLIGTKLSADVKLFTNDTQRMTLLGSNGFVGIGSASPISRLSVVSDNEGGAAHDDIEIASFQSAGGGYPTYYLRASRGSQASPANLINGDLLGSLTWLGRRSGTFSQLSDINSTYRGDGTSSLSDLQFVTSGANRMRIGESGVVTVNNLSGTGSRMVVADANGALSTQTIPNTTNIYNTDGTLTGNRTITLGTNNLTLGGSGSFRVNGAVGSSSFSMGDGVFGIDGSGVSNGRFSVLENGNVGIGSSTPTSRLQVNGSFSAPVLRTSSSVTLNETHYTVIITGGTPTITFPSAASCPGRIYVIVNRTAGTRTTSGYRTLSDQPGDSVTQFSSIVVQSDGADWNKIL